MANIFRKIPESLPIEEFEDKKYYLIATPPDVDDEPVKKPKKIKPKKEIEEDLNDMNSQPEPEPNVMDTKPKPKAKPKKKDVISQEIEQKPIKLKLPKEKPEEKPKPKPKPKIKPKEKPEPELDDDDDDDDDEPKSIDINEEEELIRKFRAAKLAKQKSDLEKSSLPNITRTQPPKRGGLFKR